MSKQFETSFKTIVHDDYIEVHIVTRDSVDERVAQIESIMKLVADTRRSRLLVVLEDTPLREPPLGDLHKVAKALSLGGWSLRRRGLFLKVAVALKKGSVDDYADQQLFYKAKDLDISIFDKREEALSWLLRHYPLDNVTAFFQPIVRLDNRSIAGYEALARKIVDGVPAPPADWLPEILAEEGGSLRLSRHMLDCVLSVLGDIPQSRYISINLEPVDLQIGAYWDILKRYKYEQMLPRIVIELAERGEVPLHASEVVKLARQLNVRIALDDAGAGSSRLLGLIDLQPELIKLDKAVTDRIHEPPVKELMQMFTLWGKASGKRFIAEGIEEERQIADCIIAGVTYGQGYVFAKPMPFESLL